MRRGTVNLLLCDGCTLDAPKGIGVEPGAALHIYGQPQDTGKIKSDGCAKYSAVIGGSYFGNEKDTLTQVLNAIVGLDTGDIAIHGGTLDLKSGDYGACIGSGLNGAVGNISVYGGDIKCSAEHGAGIGGGYGGYEESDHPQSADSISTAVRSRQKVLVAPVSEAAIVLIILTLPYPYTAVM